jgi:hypothetical protein
MNYSSAGGSSIHAIVNLIMAAKPLDTIVGQPTTESMDRMTEQMVQMVTPIKTTAWGGLHGSLALVLDNVDYATITRRAGNLTAHLVQPPLVNPAIKDDTPQRELLHLQADMKDLQKSFDLQEAITNIGVQRIINSVEEQHVDELNEDYFGYANQTIKSLLEHLCTNWCKVMIKERTDATKGLFPHMGTQLHSCHHVWLSTDKTSKEMSHDQHHHLQQGQSTSFYWPDVYE